MLKIIVVNTGFIGFVFCEILLKYKIKSFVSKSKERGHDSSMVGILSADLSGKINETIEAET